MAFEQLESEEARSLFYVSFGVMLFTAVNMGLKLSSLTTIIISMFVMVGAYLLDEANKKYDIFKLMKDKK